MVDIFDEISDDLRAERAQALLKRFGALLVVAVILVIAGVGGWQFWRYRSQQGASQLAATFLGAMRDSTAPGAAAEAATPARQSAEKAYADLAASAPEGYRTLARLRLAGLKASSGDLPGALAAWDQVSADTAADPLLRGLADLMWVQHQVDAGDPAAVEGRLAPLVAQGNPWRPLAQENQALLAIRTGQTVRARDLLKALQSDATAPQSTRARAGGLLSRLPDPAVPAQGAGG